MKESTLKDTISKSSSRVGCVDFKLNTLLVYNGRRINLMLQSRENFNETREISLSVCGEFAFSVGNAWVHSLGNINVTFHWWNWVQMWPLTFDLKLPFSLEVTLKKDLFLTLRCCQWPGCHTNLLRCDVVHSSWRVIEKFERKVISC